MQAVLTLPAEGMLDCLTCSFARQKESMVAAYSDGRVAVWDLTSLAEVFSLCSFTAFLDLTTGQDICQKVAYSEK